MFELNDEDGNGTLNTKEIEKMINQMKAIAVALGRNIGSATNFIEGVMAKLDVNKDGNITKAEFVAGGLKTPSLLVLLGVDNY